MGDLGTRGTTKSTKSCLLPTLAAIKPCITAAWNLSNVRPAMLRAAIGAQLDISGELNRHRAWRLIWTNVCNGSQRHRRYYRIECGNARVKECSADIYTIEYPWSANFRLNFFPQHQVPRDPRVQRKEDCAQPKGRHRSLSHDATI